MRLGEEVEGKRVESRVAIVQFLSPRGPLSFVKGGPAAELVCIPSTRFASVGHHCNTSFAKAATKSGHQCRLLDRRRQSLLVLQSDDSCSMQSWSNPHCLRHSVAARREATAAGASLSLPHASGTDDRSHRSHPCAKPSSPRRTPRQSQSV